MPILRELLIDFNPWWKGEFNVEFVHRDIHQQIQRYLPLPQIIAFTGLRRTGKTTLMYKMVTDYLSSGFDPSKIIYFSFDEAMEIEIRELIHQYEEVMETDFRNGRYLFLMDEIQKLERWEEQVKTIYDRFKGTVKIIVSGSESLFIRRESIATLAGRIFEFKVEPLSYREFLIFRGVEYEPVALHAKELSMLLHEFILTQGFPELVGIKDKAIIKKYVTESIVEKVLYRDMPGLFKIRDIGPVKSTLNIFMEEPGQLIQLSELAKELKISRQTLSNYLIYLEESFLIRKLYNFSKSRRKVERKLKKYYPSFVSPDLLFREDNYSRSRVFEWLMVTRLNVEFFWRDPYKNEVDIVLTNGEIKPVEIKYGKIELKGLFTFMKKFNITQGYLISKDKEEDIESEKGTISIIPGYKYLVNYSKPS